MQLVSHIAAVRRRRYSIRTYTNVIVLLVLAPALIVAGWLASRWATSEHAQLQERAKQEAREISAELDRSIVSTQNMLIALASSPLLRSGDLKLFYEQALEVAQKLNAQIVLRDPARDVQMFNTAFPWNTPLAGSTPAPILEAAEQSLRSGQPAVSGLVFGPLIKKHLVIVMIPVLSNGARYLLSMGLQADAIAEILAQSQLDDNWIITLADRRDIVVARSQRHNEFVGTALLMPLPREMPSIARGTNWGGDRVSLVQSQHPVIRLGRVDRSSGSRPVRAVEAGLCKLCGGERVSRGLGSRTFPLLGRPAGRVGRCARNRS